MGPATRNAFLQFSSVGKGTKMRGDPGGNMDKNILQMKTQESCGHNFLFTIFLRSERCVFLMKNILGIFRG